MELTKCKLGELITQRREKNDGSDLPICGVSKDGLIPPKQKDADTSIYNVFYRDDFIFNPARMELNSIAINDMYDRAICSSLYEVFYVHRTDLLLPHYLELIIRQKWFTRYCEFLGQGSAREYCRFGNISEIEIEFPPIEEQQKIVEYNTAIENRIALKQKINDNLEATALSIYKCFFVDYIPFGGSQPSSWKEVTVDDIASDVICGKTPPTADPQNYGGTIPFITIPDMHGSVYTTSTARFLSEKGASTQPGKMLPANSVCVSCIASVGLVCLTAEPSQTNQQINSIICKEQISPFYVYTKMTTLNEYLKQLGAGGSTTLNINKTLFGQIPILLPDEASMKEYHNKVEPLFSSIRENQYEIQHLESLKHLLLSQLSSR